MIYKQGSNGVVIEQVTLLEDDREIAQDTHKSFGGWINYINAYKLMLKPRKADAAYTICVKLRGDGGTDSYGSVWLSRGPLIPDGR